MSLPLSQPQLQYHVFIHTLHCFCPPSDDEGMAQLQLLLARITQNRKSKINKKKQAMVQVGGGEGPIRPFNTACICTPFFLLTPKSPLPSRGPGPAPARGWQAAGGAHKGGPQGAAQGTGGRARSTGGGP